jgi:hypothetical protein
VRYDSLLIIVRLMHDGFSKLVLLLSLIMQFDDKDDDLVRLNNNNGFREEVFRTLRTICFIMSGCGG